MSNGATVTKKPNIATIPHRRVRIRNERGNTYGTAVGAIFRPYWHPYMYEALHIVTDDGREITVHAKQVQFVN